MSVAEAAAAAVPANKLGLRIDAEQDAPAAKTTPCATPTPKGYRAIELEINPSTWKPDLSKCKVCDVRFTWLNHRHKCRRCMEPVCNSCSKGRKALRAYTAPKRVCDTCIKNCWTPRPNASTTKLEAAEAVTKLAADDDRRVSLTLSTADANACPVAATATAPLSPGTPAAAGFFGLGCATPSAAATAAAAAAAAATSPAAGVMKEVAGEANKDTTASNNTDDSCPPSSSSPRHRRHRRNTSVALSSLPLASPTSPFSSPSTISMVAAKEEENEARPPSAAGSPSASPRLGGMSLGGTRLAPFFGGRLGGRGSRRESSAGRLESGTWSSERSLGGGGDVDKAVAELQRLQKQRGSKTGTGMGAGAAEQQAEGAPSSALPALPEEPTTTDAAAAAAAENAKAAGGLPAKMVASSKAGRKGEDDGDEGGPMMMNIPMWSGVAISGVAVGTGIVLAVIVRSALSLVFFY